MKKLQVLCSVVVAGLLSASPVYAADHGGHSGHGAVASTSVATSKAEGKPAPKLTLAAPKADFLEKGFVYLPFKVENMTILPLYAEIHGAEVTKLQPTVGHLHVSVNDNQWAWVHAQPDAIYFSTLPPGTHKMTVELSDAAHNVLDRQTLSLVVPES